MCIRNETLDEADYNCFGEVRRKNSQSQESENRNRNTDFSLERISTQSVKSYVRLSETGINPTRLVTYITLIITTQIWTVE